MNKLDNTLLLESTLHESAYWMVNKALSKALGSLDAAVLLSDLISKRKYFREKGWLDSDGGFFNTTENIESDLIISKKMRLKYTNQLKKLGLLRVHKKGMPSKNYYYINDSAVIDILSQSDRKGSDKSGLKGSDKSPRKGSTNNNKQTISNLNNLKDSTSKPCNDILDKDTSLSKEKAKEKKVKKILPLASMLSSSEFESLASVKVIANDDYAIEFLTDIVDVPVEDLTAKQIKMLEKLRKKADKGRKADKVKPLNAEEIHEQYLQSLYLEKHIQFVKGLDPDVLMYAFDKRRIRGVGTQVYGVKLQGNDDYDTFLRKVINQIRIDAEKGRLESEVYEY